ncbi:hypothetical protein H012_gp070 [Acanthamoeba polyphaga moumouvirus]|uniref:Uncharacterized protein n=1 Tax=Acanthamoeba polyphaga moumouvirus TaxID=1269028 RepID=L7RE30_9VIRU|nr:hypothetical protein H012_gp070 [Acanthamoeba polyphaga moumouvirus]AGC02378.1 hypothetical protein Moumou_00863 [Acanthamoeba polyphaga moumouvirus]
MATDNIITFEDFTFGFEENTIFAFHQGKKIGSVHQDTRSLLWVCEYNASKACFNQVKQWAKYCKDQCYHDYGERFIHHDHTNHCEFPEKLIKIISHDPNMDKYKHTITWTSYKKGGLTSALDELKQCWILLKDIN